MPKDHFTCILPNKKHGQLLKPQRPPTKRPPTKRPIHLRQRRFRRKAQTAETTPRTKPCRQQSKLPYLDLSQIKSAVPDSIVSTSNSWDATSSRTHKSTGSYTKRSHHRLMVAKPKSMKAMSARVSASYRRLDSSLRLPCPGSPRTKSKTPRKAKAPGKAISGVEALKTHLDILTGHEQSELLEIKKGVYYVGQNCKKKIVGDPQSDRNCGYDDQHGDYRIRKGDHIAYRYEILGLLGKGSFGIVVKVLDHKTDTKIALKLIKNKRRFHHQAAVEVKILEHCMKHMSASEVTNIVEMKEHFYFRDHLCITFELLALNLYEHIKKGGFRSAKLPAVRHVARQLLQALQYTSKQRIVHCDVKPENVMLVQGTKWEVKLIDFGSSCLEDEQVYTYIQSRFYRSPEVILGMPYDSSIDMWSLGCVLAELHTGYPIFPGEDEQQQMQCIMQIFGVPPKEVLKKSSRRDVFFNASATPKLVRSSRGRLRRPSTKTLREVLRSEDRLYLDFIRRCLEWDPKRRISASQGLRHPWILGTTRTSRTVKMPNSARISSMLPSIKLRTGGAYTARTHTHR